MSKQFVNCCFHPFPILPIRDELLDAATSLFVEDYPMVHKQSRVSQRGGDGCTSDAQPWYQDEGGDYRDTEADYRGVEVDFRLTGAGEIVGQNGVGRVKHDAGGEEQDDRMDVGELARKQPLKERSREQT